MSHTGVSAHGPLTPHVVFNALVEGTSRWFPVINKMRIMITMTFQLFENYLFGFVPFMQCLVLTSLY